MQVKSTAECSQGAEYTAECSQGAFCNTFDLHQAIIGLENLFRSSFELPLETGLTVLRKETKCVYRLQKTPTLL